MSQNTLLVSRFDPAIPEVFHAGLRQWAAQDVAGDYSDDEQTLFRSMALAYASSTKPTMRQLYDDVCEMLDEDEKRSGITTPKPLASTFRRLILSLPSDFVDFMRYGQPASRFAILETARPFVEQTRI
ncbi:hypothetical protein [Rhizobium sp. BG4]|uniref:hypothetical protein n=1 Tax=Rhizobium sp. BG4 TaxID=2613770 RepID=UPI00193CB5C9|nr:hypothetical protein [Rhizobium sp. BG4]QRM44606.1 hypothetical protein F2982_14835 [Rhizobium sp. BG4]